MSNAGNAISLAFMNPAELLSKGLQSVPLDFDNTTQYFRSKGKNVYFSIGGAAYSNNWNWLSSTSQSAAAGKICAQIANTYSVGIEIDYEGGSDPSSGLTAFIQSFRANCPVGRCVLSMDLYGSPGGQFWQTGVVQKLLPSQGVPGERVGSGDHLDFVNVMVIDGQTVQTAITFWQQWMNAKLPMRRSTFGLIAGWPGLGICQGDSYATSAIDTAWSFLQPYGVYGIMSWAVCPPRAGSQESCGDWSHTCNANAPGFHYLCNKLSTC
jgi:hypothetical protein